MKSLAHIGYETSGDSFIDQLQGIRGQFVVSGSGPRLEIVEDLPGSRTVSPWLRRSTVFYHVAFEVSSFDAQLGILVKEGAKVVGNGVSPSVAFGGRRICHLMQASRMIVELVEKVQAEKTRSHND